MGSFFDPDTVSGHKTSEVVSALQKCIRRGLRDDALHWAVELYLSGHTTRLWNRMEIIVSEDIGPAAPELPAVFSALRKSFETMAKKKSPHAPEKLFAIHAVILLADAKKSRIVDDALIVHFQDHRKRPIPDVALDKHTQRGRSMKRGFVHFFDVGAQLANVGQIDDPYADQAREIMLAIERRPGIASTAMFEDEDGGS